MGFSSLPVLSSLAPLLVLPIIARVGGPPAWISLTTGQALGTVAATLAWRGWSVVGPPHVAVADDPQQRGRLYIRSTMMRSAVLGLVLIPLALAAHVFAPQVSARDTFLMSLTTAVLALSPAWYLIGQGRPWAIAAFDVVPRLLGVAVAAVLMIITRDVALFPLVFVAAVLVGLAAFHRYEFGRVLLTRTGTAPTETPTRRELQTANGVELLGVAYSSAPVPLASALLSTSAVVALGSADRLYRFALLAVTAAGNALQGWALQPGHPGRDRQFVALGLHLSLGFLGGLILWRSGPFISGLLFGQDLKAEGAALVWYGIAYAAISTATPLIRNTLVPRGLTRRVAGATLAGACTGVPLMLLLSGPFGASGVAAGLAASEIVVLTIVLVTAARLR